MFCIAGADGFFGAYIQKRLLSLGESVVALNHRENVFPDGEKLKNISFELTDKNSLNTLEKLLIRQDGIKLIYLIAAHNPDFVKANPEKAEYINSTAYNNFLEKLSMCNITKLYYASSDTVYGESIDGYVFSENDMPNPVNLYGEQKAKAEEITLSQGFSVSRFPYMFAPSLNSKKHFFDTLTGSLKDGRPINMFTDYVRSSFTYSKAAEKLIKLINTDTDEKIFNVCGDNPVSKYEIGLYAAELTNSDKKLVVPTLSSETSVFTEKRANILLMSNKKLKTLTGDNSPINFI